MVDYDGYPAVDEDGNFPPVVRAALALSSEISTQVLDQTEDLVPAQVSDALAGSTAVINAITAAMNTGAYKGSYVRALSQLNGQALRQNIVTNPDFGVDLTGWTRQAGTGAGSTFVRQLCTFQDGYSALVTWTAGSTTAGGGIYYAPRTVIAGQRYATSMKVKTNSAKNLRFNYRFRDSAGTFINDIFTATTAVAANTVKTLTFATTAPAGAVSMEISIVQAGATGYWATGDILEATDLLCENVALTANVPGPYFDGDDNLSYWSGAAHASISIGGLVLSSDYVRVKEGPLSFLDIRVGGDSTAVDNAAAFNRAMALLEPAGGELFVPPGIYKFTTKPNNVPGGVWIRGTGYDYAIPGRAARMSVFQAAAAMDVFIRLGYGPTSNSAGQTGASLDGIVIDGNNLPDTVLQTLGRRNNLQNVQIQSGKVRAFHVNGQNMRFVGGVVHQDNVGDCIFLDGTGVIDNKIWDTQIRGMGTVGAGVHLVNGGNLDIERNHLWAGGNGVPHDAVALIWLEATTAGATTNNIVGQVLIDGNTVEGVLGAEIMLQGRDAMSIIRNVVIANNRFYQNNDAPDDLYSVLALRGGAISGLAVGPNMFGGSGATAMYKSFIDIDADVVSLKRSAFDGNVGHYARKWASGAKAELLTADQVGMNHTNNGGTDLKTRDIGRVDLGQADGVKTVFSFPHKLVTSPASVRLTAASPAAAGPHYVVSDVSTINITFATPPAPGAVRFDYEANC
jgi:hypothetical protein